MKTIGIIAGTKIDTAFGVEYFKKFGSTIGYPISDSPIEQTRLQALDRTQLTHKVQEGIDVLSGKKADKIIIYCNSLSGAIDLKKIREDNKIEILTPLDVYAQIANSYRLFGLIAANCQSAANIERTIIGANNDAIVIGIGNLNIVNEIERGGRPIDIIRRHNVVELCNVIAASGAEMIILGCTHFSFFHDELKKMIPHILLEPSEEMGKRLR